MPGRQRFSGALFYATAAAAPGPGKCMRPPLRLEPDSGVALIVVLLLIAILSIAVSGFVYDVRINSALIRNHQDRLRARYVAKAGVNAARGLLKHSSPFDSQRSSFQNQFIQLFHCECYSGGAMADLGMTEEQAEEQESTYFGRANCGSWSMDISYPIGEDLLHLKITDEQARLNLNALVKRSMNPEDDGADENPVFRHVLYELFSLRLRQMNIEHTEADVDAILDVMRDWMDHGTVAGKFDSDDNDYYEDGDRIYSNKNGPMDTVSEIKMNPFIRDELYYAVKDLVTVYPYDAGKQSFIPNVNFHLAGQEVLFALFRGATYEGDRPAYGEEDVMATVTEMIQKGISEEGQLIDRQVPPEFRNAQALLLRPNVPQPRFYRVVSSGITESGIIHTIETVIRVNPAESRLTLIYWRDE